jgi:hypothetical protein
MPSTDTVRKFLSRHPGEVTELALATRALIQNALPETEEMLDPSSGVIAYGFSTRYADILCTIIPSKKEVKLGIVRGSLLSDPRGLMEGKGKLHRYVALRTTADLRRPGLKPLLRTALATWKRSRA